MKTAVDYLVEQLQAPCRGIPSHIIEEAKRLEKKQITDACWYGHDIKHEYFNPIHYFDQTYNQN